MKKITMALLVVVAVLGLKFYFAPKTPAPIVADVSIESAAPTESEAEPAIVTELRSEGEKLERDVKKVQVRLEESQRILARQAELMNRLQEVDNRHKDGLIDAHEYLDERTQILQAAMEHK